MELTEDSFRALARSSPWRWRTLHFVRNPTATESWVEARIQRPGLLWVTDASGRTTEYHEEVGAGSVVLVQSSDDAVLDDTMPDEAVPSGAVEDDAVPNDAVPSDAVPNGIRFREVIQAAWSRDVAVPGIAEVGAESAVATSTIHEPDGGAPPVVQLPACDVPPIRRPDGLVAERPDSFRDGDRHVWVDYDDPMLNDYRWVAMLDPAELAAGTTVVDLAAGEHRGRPAWFATMTAQPGYEPRCGCCPLLWSAVSDLDEYGPDHQPDRPYPDSYRVGLDVQTGMVVWMVEDDHRVEIDLEILDVDTDPAPTPAPDQRTV